MFTAVLLVALLVTLAVVFLCLCGTGTNGRVDPALERLSRPIEPTFVTRNYNIL